MAPRREIAVVWAATGDVFHPFAASVAGEGWLIYLGEFPAEPLYTLLVNGEPVESFDTWPAAWHRPQT